MYEIRLCKADEIRLLKSFLRDSWSPDHIFLKNEDILDFQHKTEDGYSFVVAYHQETKCFHGVLGIISPEFYNDRLISQNQDIWLAIWKVEKNLAKSNSLGIEMLNYVENKFKPKSVSAIGINDTVALLYKLMGFKIKKMNQWFIPNKNINDYRLIVGDLPDKLIPIKKLNFLLVECNFEHKTILKNFLSRTKSKRCFQYIAKRYFNHPTYKYKVFAFLNSDSDVICIAVGREVAANKAKILRLTELFLDQGSFANLGLGLVKLMTLNSYEYIDFMEYGYDELSLLKSGFIQCSDKLFVPHLFEPFVAERKQVKVAYKSKLPFSCTKGDSDLDRPNLG